MNPSDIYNAQAGRDLQGVVPRIRPSQIIGLSTRQQASAVLPAGLIQLYGGLALPDGWLECDGDSLSRSAFSTLFAAIGTTYGSVDSDHFNLPDLRGRVPVGQDTTQTEFDIVGETGGAKEVTLTTAQIPAHAHGVNDPTHNHGINDPGHTHYHKTEFGSNDSLVSPGQFAQISFTAGRVDPVSTSGTGISINGNGTGISIQNAGGGGAHNNLQPYLVMRYIIRY